MLSEEMRGKLKRAGEYQKKAILELLPEGMEGHLSVIGKELEMMAKEYMAGSAAACFAACKGRREERPDKNRAADPNHQGVRRVTIS